MFRFWWQGFKRIVEPLPKIAIGKQVPGSDLQSDSSSCISNPIAAAEYLIGKSRSSGPYSSVAGWKLTMTPQRGYNCTIPQSLLKKSAKSEYYIFFAAFLIPDVLEVYLAFELRNGRIESD
jgi:hypothetical protein